LLGKGAGVAAAGTVAPMAVVKALKAASPEVKALAPEAKLGAKEAVKVVSRLTPAQLRVGDALESISNWSGTQLPAHFDDIMRGARELRPGASDDAIAKGIANFEQLYHQGHASFYFDSLPQTGKFKGLGWSELNKQGIKTQQDLFGAVFDGKIKPSQLQEDIFAGRHIDGPGPASNLFNDMLGHAEGDSAFPSGEKYAEILKYFDDLEEVSKHTGNPSAVTDSIREQARDWASDTRRW